MAFKKILFVILDGLGDRPIKNLEGKTPLEAARTPNMDFFAQNGICGVQNALPKGVYPTSEECHLALFGYHYIKDYPGRGVLEALGLGIKLNPGDLALRVDFGTVDEDLRVVDPRAGNISRTIEFSEAIGTREVDGFNFEIYSGLAHRGVLIISGKDLSENVHAHSSMVSDTDPHKDGPHKKDAKVLHPQPLDSSQASVKTAKALWKYQLEVNKYLNTLPLNEERIKKGLLPVNFLLTRGSGTFFKVPSYKEKYGLRAAAVAGAPLYIGIARYLGMDFIKVNGANGLSSSNYKSKVVAAKKALKNHDFVYLHFKAVDTCAEERGDYMEKKILIEKIDRELKAFRKLKNTLIFISGDHTTACELQDHAEDPVPFLIYDGKNRDSICEFGETGCRFGALKHLRGREIFKTVLKKSGRITTHV